MYKINNFGNNENERKNKEERVWNEEGEMEKSF